MSFQRPKEAIKASGLAAGKVGSYIPWWMAYVLGAVGLMVLGAHMIYNQPDTYEIIFFLAIALFWVGLCGLWAGIAKRSFESQDRMLTEIEYFIDYINSMNGIVQKSLNGLATYDRDKAVELAAELNAVSSKSLYDAYWREENTSE